MRIGVQMSGAPGGGVTSVRLDEVMIPENHPNLFLLIAFIRTGIFYILVLF
jgi:hypothetical protein